MKVTNAKKRQFHPYDLPECLHSPTGEKDFLRQKQAAFFPTCLLAALLSGLSKMPWVEPCLCLCLL